MYIYICIFIHIYGDAPFVYSENMFGHSGGVAIHVVGHTVERLVGSLYVIKSITSQACFAAVTACAPRNTFGYSDIC